MTPELRLLLASATAPRTQKGDAAIRQLLGEGVDWTLFAQKAVSNEVAALAGHTFLRVAPELVPDDILDAFSAVIDQTRRTNQALFEALGNIIEILANKGIDVIPFDGPVLSLRAFGDFALRQCAGLDLIIRDADLPSCTATLIGLGYEQREDLASSSNDSCAPRLFVNGADISVRAYSRLTPAAMALDIDYPGLWQRARQTALGGRTIRTLTPEDEFVVSAVRGGNNLWGSIKGVCDASALIASHPSLDWAEIVEHARAQGCLHMVLVAVSLARNYLNTAIPDAIIAAEVADPVLASAVIRIATHWENGPTSARTDIVANSSPMPASPEADLNIGQYRQARTDAERALAANPNDAAAWRRLGHALFALKDYRDAVAAYDKALAFEPEHPVVWNNRRASINAIGPEAALSDITVDPQDAAAWTVRAGGLFHAQRFTEAIEATDRVLAIDSGNIAAARLGIHARLFSCDWSRREQDKARVTNGLQANEFIIRPLDHRGLCESESENRLAASLVAREFSAAHAPLWNGELYRHERLRIAYLSTDLRTHAVGSLIVGCFEQHDKRRFETIGISLQKGDGSELRQRMESAFDRFVNAQTMSDAAVAELVRMLEVDVLVDLNGYTGRIRSGILARRPAAVQVNYLGYPGTMDVPFVDYILADRVVIPPENQIHYRENVAYLPHCYLPNDNKRRIAGRMPTRVEAELPETGFVFACLNYAYKIAPEMFAIWMRLLRQVDGSVLWLRATNGGAIGNLRREARAHGVAPERLVFAPPVPRAEQYLARLRLADLFLDTLPYNAHATACDALWAGLPVLTCMGKTFPGRVAGSLLQAVGLPELVTSSLGEYEEMARSLALNPERLAAIKAKLMRNRSVMPLFDTALLTRDLESAYSIMCERTRRGEPPASFVVPDSISLASM